MMLASINIFFLLNVPPILLRRSRRHLNSSYYTKLVKDKNMKMGLIMMHCCRKEARKIIDPHIIR